MPAGSRRLEQFQRLVESYPNDATLHFGLGKECQRAKRHGEAIKAFRSAIRLKPDYSAAYRELGRILMALERFREAEHIFEEGISVARRTGDLQTAKEMKVFLRRLSDRSPDMAQAEEG